MPITLEFLHDQLELADALLTGRNQMFEPQDLPGRYGGVVRAVDRVLCALDCEAVLAGGWAVWRHGYLGRVTQDLDVVVPADRVDEFVKIASISGFDLLSTQTGNWPKLQHKDTGTQLDLLPEGGRPGTLAHPAPTTIPHPARMGAGRGVLRYISLPHLIELKLAAGRARDDSDIIELIRANQDQVEPIRQHLAAVHADYASSFDKLTVRAADQRDA